MDDPCGNTDLFATEKRLEIAYLDATGQPVIRGRAIAVRRRVLDFQGRVLQEKIRRKLS